jgi:hypothetical protein
MTKKLLAISSGRKRQSTPRKLRVSGQPLQMSNRY